jgi:hypothetical protein
VTWFEPDPPDPPSPVDGQPPRRARRAWLLAAPAVTLALGMVLGFALESARSAANRGARPRPALPPPNRLPPR